MIQKGGQDAVGVATEVIDNFSKGTFPPALASMPGTETYRSAWEKDIRAAESNNEPGRFTAFIGYEWTSNTGGNNLHRVVVFRDGADKARQVEPYTTIKPLGSDDPKDLWKVLQSYEDKTGGNVLAIAHNGNLSNGIMFPEIDSFTGKPITREYAQTRAKWEHLYEATQMKGDGEAHPFLSPTDEFANYERWDKFNLNMSVPKENNMLQYEYARSALQIGLQLEPKLGINPYKVGMIGSTDTHTGSRHGGGRQFLRQARGNRAECQAHGASGRLLRQELLLGWTQSASGYAGVWATENTREAIFDAMERRETYATTGPRMIVRFFGGWDFVAADAQAPAAGERGLRKGRADGRRPAQRAERVKSPSFLVAALKDPMSGNLDRIQIVKGWVDAKGARQEKIYDVAWSDNRKPGADGKLPAVGNTVDVANATWTNTIGAAELITVWKDPDFDAVVARGLLRTRDRNPDAALDRIRCESLRCQGAGRRADDDTGARLHLADLVHARKCQIRVKEYCREPLPAFRALLGALLFGAYSWVNRDQAPAIDADHTIRITERELDLARRNLGAHVSARAQR